VEARGRSYGLIAIAGAGIGGLALGCALAHHGMPFRVFEKAPELKPVGAGIAIADNALRALAHIGLDERVRAHGRALERADICAPSGRVISSLGRLPFPVVVMSRTALQQALLGPIADHVECGRAVAGYERRPQSTAVRLEAGEVVEADLLVGADGLRSQVRRTMRGEEPLRYSGQTSWRALVDGVVLPEPDRMIETWGGALRFGVVPLGGRRTYWFAVAEAPAGGQDPADVCAWLRERFGSWHAPIDAVLAGTPNADIVRTDIFDRTPITKWSDGRTVLLGDAAHPMTPNLGQGGCQAIEDAVVLADALAKEPTVEAALARYQARRIPRANRFVARSRALGRLAHVRSTPLRWLRDRALASVPRRAALRALERDLEFKP
jgi:2-polyprenyl-6-methoxyphenol hydroxylase-like FAD-dependent oxidoreductase